jgi:hypothetical protein
MTPEEMESFDRIRDRIVRTAVAMADNYIIVQCRGNPEVLMMLTSDVALAFANKINLMIQNEVNKKQMLCEIDPEVFKDFYKGL